MYESLKHNIAYSITPGEYWECTSHACNSKGYPFMRRKGKMIKISRYMYTQKNGAIPKGMVIRHKCDNRKCINPDHFEIGTQRQNMQDMVERGRSLTGEKHPLVKLTEAQVIEIWERALKGECHLAKEYGVSYSTISKIRKGERWKHI